MKGRRVAFVGAFCVAGLMASGAYGGKPVKTPKPEPPGRSKPECIVFTDNPADSNDPDHVWLVGSQDCAIVGCCPNAGPSPQYEMTLYNVCYLPAFGTEECLKPVPVLGYVFMNAYGRNAPYEGWKVQFWTWNYQAHPPGDGDFFFQIRGGTEVPQGKKSKVSVVEFLNEEATLWVYYNENEECNFPSETGCEPCETVTAACDPWSNPDCHHPCWIERTIYNVSFVKVRTADLSYTSEEPWIVCPDITCSYP